MSKLSNFTYEEFDDRRTWKYGKPGHPEARVENPGKYGSEDWKAIMVAPASLELAPTMPAIVMTAGAMVVSQLIWPEHEAYDLGLAGYLEQVTAAKTITDVILIAHACDLNWQLHRERHGRAR